MVNIIKPSNLSYEDYLKEKKENPLFFWNYKSNNCNVFINSSSGYNIAIRFYDLSTAPLFSSL